MSDVPWYQELFGEAYLRVWGPFQTPERTAQEIEGIVQLLALPQGSRILDLCCGYGRHAIPLAQRGYRVTGQDLSRLLLERAQADVAAQGVRVEWVHGDMRAIPFQEEFDAVINIFTSFGYLENEEEDRKVLQQVSQALKPGGRFLIETIQRDGMLRRFAPQAIRRPDDSLIVLDERQFDLHTSRIEVRHTLIYPDGRRENYHHSVRLYTLTELAHLMASAGLHLESYYGGLDASPLTTESWRLVVMSRK